MGTRAPRPTDLSYALLLPTSSTGLCGGRRRGTWGNRERDNFGEVLIGVRPGAMPQAGSSNFLLNRIALSCRQLVLPDLRKILDPAIVDNWDRQDSLTAHTFIPNNGIVGCRRAHHRGE